MIFTVNKSSGSCEKRSAETADAVVRAAQIRIRSLCQTNLHGPKVRLEMACGLIAGLRDRLKLHPMIGQLVAYVYGLVDDESAELLTTSRVLLQQSIASRDLPAFRKGLSEARAIVEMVENHERQR